MWMVDCGAAFVTQLLSDERCSTDMTHPVYAVLGTMNNFGIFYVDIFEAFGGSASKTCKSAFVILAFNRYPVCAYNQ